MFIRSKNLADKRERSGLTSYFMLGRGDVEGDALAVTWVDVQPGRKQRLHNHPEVQIYVVIAGTGQMHIDESTRTIAAGDCIFIPSNAMHGIDNIGDSILSYISAATPAFNLVDAYDKGQLVSEAYND